MRVQKRAALAGLGPILLLLAGCAKPEEGGGPDQKIVLNSRETSSGTYQFFQEHVLGKGTPFAATALLQPATSQIVDNVAQDKGGIGYVGLGYVKDKVKAPKIKKDAASPQVKRET